VAAPLPTQFAPLLSETVEKVKNTISRVMPVEKPLTALEEAMFEDEGGEEGALEREMLSQCKIFLISRPKFFLIIIPSDANSTHIPTQSHCSWPSGNGSRIYWCRCTASLGGLPHPKLRAWYIIERLD
jgi:hypothetical protein